MNASRSTRIEYAEVGTSALRSTSPAECTDHARRHGRAVAAAAMREGEGPPVETQTLRLEKAMPLGGRARPRRHSPRAGC